MEYRTQLFFYDDLSFEFKKRQVEASCLVEKKGDQIIRAWKDFYGTLLTFPGHGNIKPAHVSLGYSRDIILDPFNRVPTGESVTQKPQTNAASVQKWIAKVAENRRHLLRGKRKTSTIAEYAQIAMIILVILEGLAIGARYAFSHNAPIPEAGILTLTLLGLVKKKKAAEVVIEPEVKEIKAEDIVAPIIAVKSPRNWRRLVYFGGGVITALVTIGAGYFYFRDTSNMFIGIVFFAALASSIFLLFKGFRSERYTPMLVSKKQTQAGSTHKPNSLNIYTNEILFEYVEKPLGQPHLCRNDKHHYYVHKMIEQGVA